jgi:hypothetical protein
MTQIRRLLSLKTVHAKNEQGVLLPTLKTAADTRTKGDVRHEFLQDARSSPLLSTLLSFALNRHKERTSWQNFASSPTSSSWCKSTQRSSARVALLLFSSSFIKTRKRREGRTAYAITNLATNGRHNFVLLFFIIIVIY